MKEVLLLTGTLLGFALGFFIASDENWIVPYFIALAMGICGMIVGFVFWLLYAAKERQSLGTDSVENLYSCVRHSDMTGVLECLIAGAKASDLKESTVCHAVRRIRYVLKIFRFIGY